MATGWKKLIDKLEQIKAGEAIANKKGRQTNAGKSKKNVVFYNENYAKGSVSHSTSTGKPR